MPNFRSLVSSAEVWISARTAHEPPPSVAMRGLTTSGCSVFLAGAFNAPNAWNWTRRKSWHEPTASPRSSACCRLKSMRTKSSSKFVFTSKLTAEIGAIEYASLDKAQCTKKKWTDWWVHLDWSDSYLCLSLLFFISLCLSVILNLKLLLLL